MDRGDPVTGILAGPGKLLSRTVVVTSFTSTKNITQLRCPQKRVNNSAMSSEIFRCNAPKNNILLILKCPQKYYVVNPAMPPENISLILQCPQKYENNSVMPPGFLH